MKLWGRKRKPDQPDIFETVQEGDSLTRMLVDAGHRQDDQNTKASDNAQDAMQDDIVRAARSIA